MIHSIYHPAGIARMLQSAGLGAKKSLGQNFFLDEALLEEMVHFAGIKGDDTVLEIGPGLGALTRVIANRAERVIAVEIDVKLAQLLRQNVADLAGVQIVEDDILNVGESKVASLVSEPFKVVANLPYYATTPILMHLLSMRATIVSITVLVQREVIGRLMAEPGSKDYGVLTVLIRRYADAVPGPVISSDSFYPPPRVDSQVVRFDLKADVGSSVGDACFLKVVRAGLNMRRKTLLNNISALFPQVDKAELSKDLMAWGFADRVRAETLDVARWEKLALELQNKYF